MSSDHTDKNFDWQALYSEFERYVSEHKQTWLGVAKSVPGANQQDAEDGYQEAVAKLWKKVKKTTSCLTMWILMPCCCVLLNRRIHRKSQTLKDG